MARIALVIGNRILDVASPACPVFANISTIEGVVVFIVIDLLIDRWQSITDFTHDCVKVAFDDLSQCCLFFFEIYKATTDYKLAAHVIFDEVEPVLISFFV